MRTPATEHMAGFPIITLIQPWASWVAMGWKTGETRTSGRLLKQLEGKFFFIHAGKGWDREWSVATKWMNAEQRAWVAANFDLLPSGQILAAVLGGKMRPMTKEDEPIALIGSTYMPSAADARIVGPQPLSRWILPLTNLSVLDEPIPASGKQGIWYLR